MSPLRALSRSTHTIPTSHISRLIRQGNYHSAIQHFIRRPPKSRTVEMHEQVIQACARVPDAAAAQAVLHAMPAPTASAAAHVVTALCRERDVVAAVDLVERLPSMGIPVDDRLIAAVVRAAHQDAHVLRRLRALPLNSVTNSPERRYRRRVTSTEALLRNATGDVQRIESIWARVQSDNQLRSEVGVMAAAVTAFASSGWLGGPNAVNALMTWVTGNMHPDKGTRYTQNPSAMALLLTSSTKALAAAARPSPALALSAYDALQAMRLPLFDSSLPLTGAYFKVLQHAALPLSETLARIEAAQVHHIQFDEQAFSMALGAILRCDARLSQRLAEGRKWIELMRSAAIPLTVHTYNLLAGQLRYCNDPEMVTALLADMSDAGITPTAVTYGLAFSACVIPGEYTSVARKTALPVSVWTRVLEAMEEHMSVSGVSQTSNSRLSLARAYAHLGRTSKALNEFDDYLSNARITDGDVSRHELEYAYDQMLYNFAHCRECSSDGPHAAISLYREMQKEGFAPSGHILDSLLVASVRAGNARAAVDLAAEFAEHGCVRLSETGLRHLLKAQGKLRDPSRWEGTRSLLLKNRDVLESPELRQTVQELVINFARCQRRDLCDDIMAIAGIEVSDLEYVLKGREFLRFRRSRRAVQARGDGASAGQLGSSNRRENRPQEQRQSAWETRSRSLHDDSLIPLA